MPPTYHCIYNYALRQEVMEVLTGPERRRRWSVEEKFAMVKESLIDSAHK